MKRTTKSDAGTHRGHIVVGTGDVDVMRKWIMTCGVLPLLCVVAAESVLAQTADDKAGTPRIEVSSSQWDFGTIFRNQTLTEAIEIRNRGKAPLTLDATTSCGCVIPLFLQTTVEPGQSTVLSMEFKGVIKYGPTAQTLIVLSNDPQSPEHVIRIVGDVVPMFNTEPDPPLIIGRVYTNEKIRERVVLTNNYPRPVSLKLRENQNFGPMKIELRELDAGQRYELLASADPPLRRGGIRFDVVLETGLEWHPELKLRASGIALRPIYAIPFQIVVASNVTEARTREIVVNHAPGLDVKVTGVKATPKPLSATYEPIPADPDNPDAGKYRITVQVPLPDDIDWEQKPRIEIMTDAKEEAWRKITVPLKLFDVSAAVKMAPGQLAPATAPTTAPAE